MSWYNNCDPKNIIRVCESEDFIVEYDKSRGMYRVSFFENNHFQDEVWFDAYEEKELGYIAREKLANRVEEKMMYMCGCCNCIESIKRIIKNDVKPFESQCAFCKVECDSKGKLN